MILWKESTVFDISRASPMCQKIVVWLSSPQKIIYAVQIELLLDEVTHSVNRAVDIFPFIFVCNTHYYLL